MSSTPLRALLLLAVVAGFASCKAPRFSVNPYFSSYQFDGTLSVVAAAAGGGGVGTGNTFNGLGIKGGQGSFGLHGDLDFGRLHFEADWVQTSASGSGVLQAGIDDGQGNVITAGTPVQSSLKFSDLSGWIMFDVIPSPDWEASLGLSVMVTDTKLDIQSSAVPTLSANLDQTIPLPMLAGRFGVILGDFEIRAQARGLTATVGDISGSAIDSGIVGRWYFFGASDKRAGAVTFGYRYMIIDINYSQGPTTTVYDFNYRGPSLGIEFSI